VEKFVDVAGKLGFVVLAVYLANKLVFAPKAIAPAPAGLLLRYETPRVM
jgi:hypothetical protein